MANPDRNNQPKTRRTEQDVANSGFDETFQVPTVELLAFNASSNSLDRVQINSSGEILTNADVSSTLPAGAATSAKQDTGNTSLATIATNTTGLATASNQSTANTSLSTIATNTTGVSTSANQTNGTQQTNITDGTNIANVQAIASGQNALTVGGAYKEMSGLAAGSLNADIVPSTNVGAYKWFSLQVTGTWTGTLTFQGSNDNSNFVSVLVINISNTTGSAVLTSTANGLFSGHVSYKYLRVRMTSYTSGTANGVLELYTSSTMPPQVQVSASSFASTQSGTWTVGSNSATGSAVPANAFYLGARNSAGNLAGVQLASDAINTTGNQFIGSSLIAQFDDVSPTAITENNFGNLRMSSNRNLYGTIRDAAGNERGANVDANNNLQIGQMTASNLNAVVYGYDGSGNPALATESGGTLKTSIRGGLMPLGTALTTYSVHLTTNTTTTPTASTAYISSISISSEVTGTTSTVTIQDKQGTPLKLVNGFSTTTLTTVPTVVNFQTPIKMTSGIDIITAGAVAATVDVWINYYQ